MKGKFLRNVWKAEATNMIERLLVRSLGILALLASASCGQARPSCDSLDFVADAAKGSDEAMVIAIAIGRLRSKAEEVYEIPSGTDCIVSLRIDVSDRLVKDGRPLFEVFAELRTQDRDIPLRLRPPTPYRYRSGYNVQNTVFEPLFEAAEVKSTRKRVSTWGESEYRDMSCKLNTRRNSSEAPAVKEFFAANKEVPILWGAANKNDAFGGLCFVGLCRGMIEAGYEVYHYYPKPLVEAVEKFGMNRITPIYRKRNIERGGFYRYTLNSSGNRRLDLEYVGDDIGDFAAITHSIRSFTELPEPLGTNIPARIYTFWSTDGSRVSLREYRPAAARIRGKRFEVEEQCGFKSLEARAFFADQVKLHE